MKEISWEMQVMESDDCTFPDGLVEKVIDLMKSHHVFLFKGEMGVGKTSFIKEIAGEMGVVDLVNSPTYALVNEYKTEKGDKVFHFDLYRLIEDELYDLGFEEYLSEGVITFVEWPEIAWDMYPNNSIEIEIKVADGKRVYSLKELSDFLT